MSDSNPPPAIEGTVVPARRSRGLAWTWLFPILALGVTAWLWLEREAEKGPTIDIAFAEAPGIEAGKTHLIFRGVQAGRVTNLRLEHELDRVIVSVQLQAFAADLAREGTEFWIEKPIVSLHGITGLESLIQGNSIHALATDPDGAAAYVFHALDAPPLSNENEPMVTFELKAASIPFISRGTPVFHRGTQVGWVSGKRLSEDGGDAIAEVTIPESKAEIVRENSRFWLISAASLSASPGQIQLNLPSIGAILDGGVAFDHFHTMGASATPGQSFELSANEAAARADGPRVKIELPAAIAMRAGETRVSYLGQTVGIVEKLDIDSEHGVIRAVVRLSNEIAPLVTSSSTFAFIRPAITWDGITGLTALIGGPYIAFRPGSGGEPATEFVALDVEQDQERVLAEQFFGRQVILTAPSVTQIGMGTPVFHNGMQVGAVIQKRANSEKSAELVVAVLPRFEHLIGANTRFWRIPATRVTLGPGNVQAQVESMLALIRGGIEFGDFPQAAGASDREADAEETVRVLFDNRELASAISPPVRMSFENGQGLFAGETQLRYRGLPVGVVQEVVVTANEVVATARFFEGYDFLRLRGSRYQIVRPTISLQEVSGLETLVSGVFIECEGGTGPGFITDYRETIQTEEIFIDRPGLEIVLNTKHTKITPGAPITYNDTQVGEISSKTLSPDGSEIRLHGLVFKDYEHLVRSNSLFWDASGVEAKIGFIQLKINAPTVLKPSGEVAFLTPEEGGASVSKNHAFPLEVRRPRRAR